MANLLPIELAYLAGYFDGEGCVCFMNKPDHKYASLRMQIASADKEVLDHYSAAFGGEVKEDFRSGDKRAMYRWLKNGKHAQVALQELLPYLKAKKEVAELACSLTFETVKGKRLSDEEVALRYSVAAQVKAINNRVTNPLRPGFTGTISLLN